MKLFAVIFFFLLSFQKVNAKSAIADKLKSSIFEVVVPKFDDFPEFNRTIDTKSVPYRERMSHFESIGTAFFVSKYKLVTAAHVLDFYNRSPRLGGFYIRDHTGHVYKIHKIFAYDSERDFAVFSLKTYPKEIRPLKYRRVTKKDIGLKVCAPGNTNGLGINYRCGGEISSFGPEIREGRWNDIYFSTPASPGNSGSPLISTQGHVFGVVVRASRAENQNIATPIAEILSTRAINILDQQAKYFDFSGRTTKVPLRIQFYQPMEAIHLWKKVRISKSRHFRKITRKHYSLYKENSFPHDKNLKRSIRDGLQRPFSSGWTFSANGQDWLYSPLSFENYSIGHDQEIKISPQKIAGFEAFYIDIDFKLNQQIMDEHLRTIPDYINYYGQPYQIKSYNKARKSKIRKDQYGRIWKYSIWESKSLDEQRVLICSPVPRGSFCLMKTVPFSSVTNHTVDMWRRTISQITFQYEGTPEQWTRFLDKKYIPNFIEEKLVLADIQLAEVDLHGENIKLEGFDKLTIFPGFIPSRRSGVKLRINSLIAKQGIEEQVSAFSFFKPTSFSNNQSIDAFNRLENGVSHYQELKGSDTYVKVSTPNRYGKVIVKCRFLSDRRPLEACLEPEQEDID